MRIHTIACVAISIVASAGCSAELAQRPAATDPTNAASAEAPFRRPPAYEPDPLLNPVPQKKPAAAAVYTCPMHPEVRQPQPGRCPKCGMTLVPAESQDGAP
jgi:heavy metal-binding protein